MEDFSFNALTALLWANKLITGLVISTLLAAILIQAYWDKVGYFVMRVWHGVPVIGKVARLSKQSLMLDAHGWPKSESELCDAYYSRYEKIGAEDVDFFNKSESYLRTIGERGRRERPFWVFALIFMLIMFEAVGFAYVLVPFINQNLSANDQSWMGWLFAFLLAVASAILAEVTGRAAHKNALISKARHWWENDSDSDRPNQLKELPGIGIKHTDSDKDGKDYNRILARINTNHTVTPSRGWMITTGIWIAIIAIAAFGIRTMQLKKHRDRNGRQPPCLCPAELRLGQPVRTAGRFGGDQRSGRQANPDRQDGRDPQSLADHLHCAVGDLHRDPDHQHLAGVDLRVCRG